MTSYLFYPDNRLPLVHFMIGLPIGSIIDQPERKGCLSLMMEMLLRGTQKAPRSAFHRQLEELGSSISVHTSSEICWLKGRCLSQHLHTTFALAIEAITTPRFDPQDLHALKEELHQNLLAFRDEDEHVAEYFLRHLLYRHHPLASSPAGEASHLEHITLQDVQQAHRFWSQSLLKIGFAGDISQTTADTLTTNLKQKLPPEPHSTPHFPPFLQPQQPEIWLIDKPHRHSTQIRFATFGSENPTQRDLFWLGIVAFGGTFTSPLCQEIREKRGWSYHASAETRRRSPHLSPVVFRTAPELKHGVDCLALQHQLFQELQNGQIDPQNLKRAQNYILGRAPFSTATVYDTLSLAMSAHLENTSIEDALNITKVVAQLHLEDIPSCLAQTLTPRLPVSVICGPKDTLLTPLQHQFPDHIIQVIHYRDELSS